MINHGLCFFKIERLRIYITIVNSFHSLVSQWKTELLVSHFYTSTQLFMNKIRHQFKIVVRERFIIRTNNSPYQMPKFVFLDLPARMRDLIISSSTTLKSHTFTE